LRNGASLTRSASKGRPHSGQRSSLSPTSGYEHRGQRAAASSTSGGMLTEKTLTGIATDASRTNFGARKGVGALGERIGLLRRVRIRRNYDSSASPKAASSMCCETRVINSR
jgi:hypothetical protein